MPRLTLSPYEIERSSEAACAALLLCADEAGVLVMNPGPFEPRGAEAARDLALRAPTFGRLLDRWRWTGAPWRSGLLRSAGTGRALADAIERSRAELHADPALAPLRGLLSHDATDDEARFVEAVSLDLIRGGADPAISLPLVNAAERLAIESESAIACGEASGMIWRPRLTGSEALSLSIPIIVGADGEDLMRWRAALDEPLASLRAALHDAMGAIRAGALNGERTSARLAAESYAHAFRRITRDHAPDAGGRPIETTITLSASRSGLAVRQAAARLARIAPATSKGDPALGPAIRPASRPIVLMRVRSSAWDFGADGRSG